MAKSSNQKLKLIYLMKILLENTDDTHYITMSEMIEQLEAYGVSAERKSIYDDIECLRQYGMDIEGEKEGRTYCYHVLSRQFELPELKLLVDSVQSAKFITQKKTAELISKIEDLASKYEAKQLQRQVYVAERVKTDNEKIYLNVDAIHNAIALNHKIRFQYFQWNVKKEMELRRGGEYYEVSPWALSWDDENYYMIAYDSEAQIIKHYRVDKMIHIDEMDADREGKHCFERFDMSVYAKKTFAMYAGEEADVKMECENRLVGVMIDRFGKDAKIYPIDDGHFAIGVRVAVSMQFIHWVMALGGAWIVAPDDVVARIKEEIRRLMDQYNNSDLIN